MLLHCGAAAATVLKWLSTFNGKSSKANPVGVATRREIFY